MAYKGENLEERFLNFSLEVIGFMDKLPRNFIISSISSQLIRSATSIGANWEEAMGGLSRADFTHSANIAKKEARETLYWFKILKALLKNEGITVESLMKENEEIIKILTSIVKKSQLSGTSAAKKLVLVLSLIIYPLSLYSAKIHPSAGTTSAAFLKLGIGARAVAMGGAFAAVGGDPFSLYWNPAGLAVANGIKTAGFFHNRYFQGLGQEFLSYTSPYGRGVAGLGLNYFYTMDKLERRSGLYESDPVDVISPVEGTFGANDLAFSAGYGRSSGQGRYWGAALKVIRQSVDGESGSSAALDLGLLRDFNWRGDGYTAGFSLQNIGPGIKLASRRYDLPLILRAGLSRRLEGGALAVMEADIPVDNYPSFTAGMEYPLTSRLFLRSAYRYRLYGNELGAWSGFSAGAGVLFDRLSFDYAFTPFGELGNSHRFSMSMRFGADGEREAVPLPRPGPQSGYSGFVMETSLRPLSISSRGAKYEITAVSSGCAVTSMRFVVLVRGEASVSIRMDEGEPSGEFLSGVPEGVSLLKIWRPSGLPGGVQGDIRFEFVIPGEKAAPVFMFKKGDKWMEVPVLTVKSGGGVPCYSASAPASSHYALGTK